MRAHLAEQTWIDYKPASFGSRGLAYAMDFAIRWGSVVLFLILVNSLFHMVSLENLSSLYSGEAEGSILPKYFWLSIVVFLLFLIEWSYPIYFDVFRSGISPGKRMFGLRVVSEKGLPITFRTSAVRTLLSTIDHLPGLGLTALISMFFSNRSQRLGDLVAGTMVLYDTDREDDLLARFHHTNVTTIPIEHYRLLESYLARKEQLIGTFREQTQTKVWNQLVPYMDADGRSLERVSARDSYLELLYDQSHPQLIGEGSQANPVDWNLVRKELRDARDVFTALERQGNGIGRKELREAANTYQLICQRYAFLSTFYRDTREARASARLVRLGRRIIYGNRLEKLETKENLLVRANRGYALIKGHCHFAALLGIVSGAVAAALVILNPAFGWHFISEQIADDLANGSLWTDHVKTMNDLATSMIITNNIKVSFMAFAGGIIGGVGTILVVILNGALLGGTFAVLNQYHMDGELLNFVAAHGFLELSVIVIAAGCGLALGDALIAPGDLTRLKSLQQRAKPACDVLLFSVLWLIPAGFVEGYISPYRNIPLGVKVLIGMSLAILFWLTISRRQKA